MIPENNDLRIEVTTRCNYNCTICPRDKLTRKKETMSFGLFKMLFDKVLSETKQYTTLTFPGMGEPLLDESLDEKIAYTRKHGLETLVLTNGYLLSVDRFRKLQELGVQSIRVSFYGNNPETYSEVHGIISRTVFSEVRDALTAISKMKRKTKLLLTFNVVNGSNEDDVDDWIKYWKDKADLIEVWRPHNWVDAKSYRTIQQDALKTCGRPFNGPLQVQVDGTVNMCCFDFDGKLTLGDLKKQSLVEIFSSRPYKKILECHTTGNFEDSGLICEKCDQRNKDKTEVMIYNSKFDISERVKMTSSTYKKIT